MKATGIIRKIDGLGRIVLPKEMRNIMNIVENETPLEIFIDEGNIILKKYNPGCHCCENMEDLVEVMGLKICPKCLEELNKARELINKVRR
ncbi:AbrB/MazE/SpoVT family DNA-binding domain-containing protein [Clostridium botulinum]|nr:AbrB/MazE/SpoVT family DNA-binding domain-containing protein [Clostridium botulinum]